jgi:outer membrane biosynthesis protein TonB
MTTKTKTQKSSDKEYRLLDAEERGIFSQIATEEAPHSQRAQALLAIDEGATQAEAGIQAGLTQGQVRYWLDKFRKDGTSIFPEELLNQAQPEDVESPPSPLEVQQDLPDAEDTAGSADEAAAQKEPIPKTKKKSKKKPKKKTKKAKKSKKPKKAKKKKKGEKSKKKGSKKVKDTKGKSNKKPKKKSKK